MKIFFSKERKLTVLFYWEFKSKQKISLQFLYKFLFLRRIAFDVITYNKIPAVFKTFVQTTLLEYVNKEKTLIQQIIDLFISNIIVLKILYIHIFFLTVSVVIIEFFRNVEIFHEPLTIFIPQTIFETWNPLTSHCKVENFINPHRIIVMFTIDHIL